MKILLLCLALFTGYAAKAQAKDGAEALRGAWSLPDCKSTEEALMISRGFTLRTDRDGSSLWPIISTKKQKDYWIFNVEGHQRPLRLEADGVLKFGKMDGPAPQSWPPHWDALKIDSRREYMGCAETPALLPDPLVRAMKQIDAVEEACHASLTAACKAALFKAADENGDKKISPREFKRAGETLVAVGALFENGTLTRELLDKSIYQSMRESDRLLAQFGNRNLTQNDFDGFVARANSALLYQALHGVGMVIPGLALQMPGPAGR